MTCIVGLQYENDVVLGADAVGSDGWLQRAYTTSKLVVLPAQQLAFGYTTSYRAGELIRRKLPEAGLPMPPHAPGDDVWRYVLDVVEVLRTIWKEGGYMTLKDSVESGAQLLIACRGRLYSVNPDLSVLSSADGYDAVGNGCLAALGSLHTSACLTGVTPADRALLALQAAAHCTSGVGPPFEVLHCPYDLENSYRGRVGGS